MIKLNESTCFRYKKKKKVNKTAENQRKQKILNVIRQKKITF